MGKPLCLRAPGPLWAACGLHSLEDRPCSLQSEAPVWVATEVQPGEGEEVQILSCRALRRPLVGGLGRLQLPGLSSMLNPTAIALRGLRCGDTQISSKKHCLNRHDYDPVVIVAVVIRVVMYYDEGSSNPLPQVLKDLTTMLELLDHPWPSVASSLRAQGNFRRVQPPLAELMLRLGLPGLAINLKS